MLIDRYILVMILIITNLSRITNSFARAIWWSDFIISLSLVISWETFSWWKCNTLRTNFGGCRWRRGQTMKCYKKLKGEDRFSYKINIFITTEGGNFTSCLIDWTGGGVTNNIQFKFLDFNKHKPNIAIALVELSPLRGSRRTQRPKGSWKFSTVSV